MQNNETKRRGWVEVGKKRLGRLYASVNRVGHISVSGWTHERMGGPTHYVLMFDRRTRAVGLRAAKDSERKDAFLAGTTTGKGNRNRRIYAGAFLSEAGLLPEATVRFEDCRIEKGVLVLEFGDVRQSLGAGETPAVRSCGQDARVPTVMDIEVMG